MVAAGLRSPDGAPDEWEILVRLGWLLRRQHATTSFDVAAIDDGFFTVLCARYKGLDPDEILPLYDEGGPERMIDLTIRTGPVRRPLRRGSPTASRSRRSRPSRTASTWAR